MSSETHPPHRPSNDFQCAQYDRIPGMFTKTHKPTFRTIDAQADPIDEGATAANKAEHDLTLKQALRTYKKAIAWSLFLSTAVIMEGFDVVLITGFFALDQFQERFGSLVDKSPTVDRRASDTNLATRNVEPTYELSAGWKAAFTNGAFVGEIIGLFLCGYCAERLGFKKTMILALAFISLAISLLVFAQNVGMILVGQILCGIPWGVFQTLPTTYAADICPISLRPYLTTYVNFAWVLGMLLGSGVARGTMSLPGDWAWRLPLGLQWIWPIPLILGILFAPESPWWLVRHERISEAHKVLQRLYPPKSAEQQQQQQQHHYINPSTSSSCHHHHHHNSGPNAPDTLDLIIRANAHEATLTAGTTYRDCLRTAHGTLRRTESTCAVWVIQVLCGSSLMFFSTLFYERAGLPAEKAFSLTLGQYALGCAGTVVSWFLMGVMGRRTLYLWGLGIMGVLLCAIGLVGSVDAIPEQVGGWAAGSLLLIYTLVYDMTIGPVCYALVADLPSARLRNQTVVLARMSYNVFAIGAGTITPYQLNSNKGGIGGGWGWGAKSGWFWGVGCALGWGWCWGRLVETKGRGVEEMDGVFEGLGRGGKGRERMRGRGHERGVGSADGGVRVAVAGGERERESVVDGNSRQAR